MTQPVLPKAFFCIALLFFYSCKKDENFTSRVSFFNGVINSPNIFSLKADSIRIAENIGYDSLKANNVISSGTFALSLTRMGQLPLTFTTNLQSNEQYTAIVYDSSQRASFFIRKDVLPATPGFGRCAVRIYTLIPNAANLFLAKDTSKLIITGKTFNDFANSNSGPAFQEIDTIPIPRFFRSDSTLLITVRQPFRSGKIYTLYLTGSIKNSVLPLPTCVVQTHN